MNNINVQYIYSEIQFIKILEITFPVMSNVIYSCDAKLKFHYH